MTEKLSPEMWQPQGVSLQLKSLWLEGLKFISPPEKQLTLLKTGKGFPVDPQFCQPGFMLQNTGAVLRHASGCTLLLFSA